MSPKSLYDHVQQGSCQTEPGTAARAVTGSGYLIVPDCGPVYASAKAAEAEMLQELEAKSYGGNAFIVRDPEGYIWSIGEYNPWPTE